MSAPSICSRRTHVLFALPATTLIPAWRKAAPPPAQAGTSRPVRDNPPVVGDRPRTQEAAAGLPAQATVVLARRAAGVRRWTTAAGAASADRPGSEWPWLHRLQHDQVRHGTVARTACARRCNPAPVGTHPGRDSTALKRELLQITAPGAGMQCPQCGAVVAAAAAGRGSHEGDDAGRGRTTEAKTRVCESTSEGLIDDTVSRTEKRRTEPALRQENTGKASTRSQR